MVIDAIDAPPRVSLITPARRGVLLGMAWAAAFFGPSFFESSIARAATPAVTWWVDPASCPTWSTPLARQIALACEAAGHTCDVSSDRGTRSLALQCGNEDHWTLEAHDERGQGLWHIEVRGDSDERLRAAALWVARSEGSLSSAPPPAHPPPPPSEAVAAPVKPAAPPTARPPSKNGGIALGARFSYLPHDQARAGALAGPGLALRLYDSGDLVRFLPRSLVPYLAFSGDVVSSGGVSDTHVIMVRAGAGLVWHPGLARDILGLSIETGAGYARGSYAIWQTTASTSSVSWNSRDDLLGYALAGLLVQAPVDWLFRPFALLAAGAMFPQNLTGTGVGTLEIGCRWAAW